MKKLLLAAAVCAVSIATPAFAQDFDEGDWVVGRYQGGNYWYPATVVHVNSNNTYIVEYDGGHRDTLRANQMLPFRWGRGGRVQCKWSDGEFYDATIEAMSSDGVTINVLYDDGERQRTQTKFCRSAVQY